ncbi:MAG: T9SS type A sorting domain-containing protein [Balneola sp.]
MKHIILLLAFLIPAVSSFGQAPTTNATDPEARDSANVISIFSGAYTDVSGTDYNPNWGQAGFGTANTSFDPGTGNVVLAYPNFNYQGIQFGSTQDISTMEFLHVDIWINGTFNPNIFVISSGAEIANPITNTGAGSWISVDIPVSGITGDPTSAIQFKFDGGNGSTDSIFVDNLYFWKNASNPQSDATLSDLQVESETVAGFSAAIENYTIELPQGTTTVPQITTATATNANSSITITQATGVPGDATVVVESEDETATKTYTISFVEEVAPTVAAPAPPSRDAANVISIYSDAYTDINVDTFSASFDDSDVEEVMIDGNATQKIDFTNFVGIDFQSDKQDASAMTHFHMDFWTGETDLVGKVFNSKFSQWGGTAGEVSAFELNINTGTNPAIESGVWVSIDVPISQWTNAPQTRDDIAQFLITSNLDEVFVDNLYLYKEEGSMGGTEPTVAAPMPPSRDVTDVISIYSDAYTDITLDALSASFDDSDVAEVMIDGNATLEIDFTNFVGIDFQSDKQDASEMTHFHMDFWTSSSDLTGKVFNSKFSQWGGTTGEVSAFELSINTGTNPAIESGTWVSIDVPISDFSNSPQTRDDIAQFLITSNLDVVFVDNIYMYKEEGTTGEFVGLINGDFELGNDGSWYGNAFNIQTDGGNSFNFANVETAGNAFDVNLSQLVGLTAGESYVLTFDASTSPGNTRGLLVGIGQSAAPFYAATETVTLTETSQTFEVDVVATDDGTGNDFGSATSRVLFDMGAETGIVVIDNVSLEIADSTGGGDPMPEIAAPTPPTRNAADVISIYSDAYTDITLDALSAGFDDSDVTEVTIEDNATLKIDFTNFLGVDFSSNKQDASEMTNFHMDFWTSSPDLVGKVFNSKFSQWGGTSAEVSAFELPINTGTNPAIESGVWVSIDVPISDWTNAPQTRDDIAQFLITSNLDVVFVDNIYLYKGMAVSNEDPSEVPKGFVLDQNYPNPFNPSTNISFNIPVSGEVTLEVYNIQGQKVATLVDGFKGAGSHLVNFDASNLASGVYTYRLISKNSVQVKKMLLIK